MSPSITDICLCDYIYALLSPLLRQHEAGRLSPRPLHPADGLPSGPRDSTNDPVLGPVIAMTSSHNDPEGQMSEAGHNVISLPGVNPAHARLPG